MNRIHEAQAPNEDGIQRCARCGYILAGGSPYWKGGFFVTVTAKARFHGTDPHLDLCNVPKGEK